MKRNLHLFTLFLIAVMVLAVPLTAVADSVMPPRDYVKETENGKYVFVMLAPEQWERYGKTDIRKTYSQSGLYRNDGSATPLWTVHWYSYQVYPSSDGRHLVEMGPWASDTDELAVAFHRDGKRIKAYAIKDLVSDTAKLKHTVSHFFWRSALRYDDKQGLLFLITTDGRGYCFSITTGEIQAQEKAPESSRPKPDSGKDSGSRDKPKPAPKHPTDTL